MNTLFALQGLASQDTAYQVANDLLVWIGFGTVIGLLAKAVVPGRDPGGPIATVLLGIGGTILGCGIASYFARGVRVLPLSMLGIIVSLFGTVFVLSFYKMLGVHYYVEGEYMPRARRRHQYDTRHQFDSAAYED